MPELSHTDKDGKAKMVDVADKADQKRIAKASGMIYLSEESIRLIKENKNKKGDVLSIAEIAGIQGGKRCSELIPLCHPLNITKISVEANIVDGGVKVNSMAKCIGKTGIEMEALTATSVALLTVYDMCKAVDKEMRISEIVLDEKTKEDI